LTAIPSLQKSVKSVQYSSSYVLRQKKRVLKLVTNKFFSISINCNEECDGVCWLFSVVHSSEHEVQISYGRRCCLLACKRAWHKCDKSIQYIVIFRFLPCITGSGVDGDDFFHFFVRSLEVRMARETCPQRRCIRLARSSQCFRHLIRVILSLTWMPLLATKKNRLRFHRTLQF
jgi:hypothetical protein